MSIISNKQCFFSFIVNKKADSISDINQKLTDFSTSDDNGFYFWPGLNLAIRSDAFSIDTLLFIRSHFLLNRPMLNRWIWYAYLFLAKVSPKFFIPCNISTGLSGDIIYWGESTIEFDRSKGKINKYYHSSSPYLEQSIEVAEKLKNQPFQYSIQRPIKITSVLYDGEPLSTSQTCNEITTFSAAIKQLLPIYRQTEETRELVSYINLLEGRLGTNEIDSKAREILDELKTHSHSIKISASHGDMKAENIIVQGSDFSIIDWELLDYRNLYHDALSAIIHPVIYEHDQQGSYERTIGNIDLLDWLSEVIELSGLETLNRAELSIYFHLTLIEKYIMYSQSGRWRNCVQKCIIDWKRAVSIFEKHIEKF